ncbi:MAG: hypothetical protein JOZ40_07355 [Methylobacteriaceae bacterium]|nr:hypothetical protein [Methylobacteriaceae bacterium]
MLDIQIGQECRGRDVRDQGATDGTKPDAEVILEVGAEGGSITLYGVRRDDRWRLKRSVLTQTTDLLDVEDRASLQSYLEAQRESNEVDSREDALALMDRYPWAMLSPTRVHPEFRDNVWHAVLDRLGKERSSGMNNLVRERWRTICGVRNRLDQPTS